jgi:hypothetical protein
MLRYVVVRPHGDVQVSIMPNKGDGKYQFVNLTKGHICECKFDSVEDAIADLDNRKLKGKVIAYYEL